MPRKRPGFRWIAGLSLMLLLLSLLPAHAGAEGEVTRLVISQASPFMTIGESVNFSVQAYDSAGRPVALQPGAVRWRLNNGIGTLGFQGEASTILYADSGGVAIVTAQVDGLVAEASVTVAAPQQLKSALQKLERSTAFILADDGEQLYSRGTGVMLSPDGLLLTNRHVVQSSWLASVTFVVAVREPDGSFRRFNASVLQVHPTTDLALMQVEDAEGYTFTPAVFAGADSLHPGDWVVAIGNPLLGNPSDLKIPDPAGMQGLTLRTSAGTFQGVYEPPLESLTGEIGRYQKEVVPYLVVDWDLLPGYVAGDTRDTTRARGYTDGYSGGPLANALGEIVGINTAGFSHPRNESVQPLSLSITSEVALRFVQEVLPTVSIVPQRSAGPIRIVVEGREAQIELLEPLPRMRGETLMVAGSFVASALHVEVREEGEMITLTRGDRQATIGLGEREGHVNGEMVILSTPAFRREDVVYLPLPFVAEALGYAYRWEPAIRLATLDAPIRVMLDGTRLRLSPAPVMENGRVLVPLRGISEALGTAVSWEGATRTITLTRGQHQVVIRIGEIAGRIDGAEVQLQVPPQIIEGSTYVPLRFVGEALGVKVSWNGETRTVYLETPKEPAVPEPVTEPVTTEPPETAPVPVVPGQVRIPTANGYRSLILEADGTVWPLSPLEQLDPRYSNGSGVIALKKLPTLEGIVDAAMHFGPSVLLKADGTVWQMQQIWIDPLHGYEVTSSQPVQVPGLTDVTDVAAGNGQWIALKSDGTIWTWNDSAPVQVPDLTGVVAIAAGLQHAVALKSDGTVWTWGRNESGQLGIGTADEADHQRPAQVSGLTGVVAVAAGWAHSLALKADGTVWQWGSLLWQTEHYPWPETGKWAVPVRVWGVENVVAVAASANHSVALTTDGAVWVWGVALGLKGEAAYPVQVPGLTGVVAVSAAELHFTALTADGSIWTWGDLTVDDQGRGLGPNGSILAPVIISDT